MRSRARACLIYSPQSVRISEICHDPSNTHISLNHLAKKLPQTAAPSSRAGGAARSAPVGRAGVDLNKQSNSLGGQNEACNC